MQIEQKISTPLANEIDQRGDNMPFVLLHMERQPIINVKGNYNEVKQVWEDADAFCKENLMLRRSPTATGTQTQAGRQLDLDTDAD